MKIINNNNVYILPIENNNVIVLEAEENINTLIECLNSYFVLKKKTKCQVYDDDDNMIKTNDIVFCYLPDDVLVTNNAELRQKTVLNTSISEIIKENPNSFKSIDVIREKLFDLLTDDGFYKIRKVLSKGLEGCINFEINDFDVSSLISMLKIDDEYLSVEEIRLMVYNMLIFLSKDNPIIIYIDNQITSKTVCWINKLPKNVYIFIDNNSISPVDKEYDFLILSNKDRLIQRDMSAKEIKTLMYMYHPIIRLNMSFQTEENVELFNKYYDKNSTFFIKKQSM